MLKTIIDTLDGVEDNIKPFYAETKDEENNTRFILQVEGIDNHPDIYALKTANKTNKDDKARLIKERDSLQQKLSKVPDDFDLDEWEKRDSKPEPDEAHAAKLTNLRKEFEEKLNQANAEKEELSKQFEAEKTQMAIKNELGDALLKANITKSSYVNAARLTISPLVKTNEEGKAIVDSDMGEYTLEEYVKKWASSDDGKDFVTQPSGSDRGGSDQSGGKTRKWSEMTSSEKVDLKNSNYEEYVRARDAKQ